MLKLMFEIGAVALSALLMHYLKVNK